MIDYCFGPPSLITTFFAGNPYIVGKDAVTTKSENFHIGLAEIVGRRPTMEDAFAISSNLCGVKNREVFAVFDGHAGRCVGEK
jgi:hypothetical protein